MSALHSLLDPRWTTGCPIYTRGEVIGDTLVHCVGVPFVYWAATLLVETATKRLCNVRALSVFCSTAAMQLQTRAVTTTTAVRLPA